MRKFFITVFSLLVVFMLACAVGCADNSTPNTPNTPQEPTAKIKLVDFGDISLEADYNSTFDITQYLTVKDEDGNTYTATATLYDEKFKKVELTGTSFKLEELNYTLKLSVQLTEDTSATRRIAIAAIDYSPYNIEFSVKGLPTWGINHEFVLPTAVGVRELSGETDEATIKVYLDGETKTEQTVIDGQFTPTKVGKYIVEASLVDENVADTIFTKSLSFDVLEDMPKSLADFSAGADNIRSAGEFSANKGEAGVYLESYTDMDGVTQYGIGKATMKSGESAGRLAIRFDKTKDELIALANRIESITFRVLVTDADIADGDACNIKFFNLIEKQAFVNKWTDITLTKAEIFNETLVSYFGNNEALVESYSSKGGTYGFAYAFAKTGVGYMQKGWGTAYRMLHSDAYKGQPTDVYIDEIFYDTAELDDFGGHANRIKSATSFAEDGTSEWLASYADKNGDAKYGIGKATITGDANAMALRFNKTKDELVSITNSIKSITFSMLVKDGDIQEGERVPLKFFGETLQDTQRNPIVNEWTTVTLTREEILNDTLLSGFADEQAAIEAFATAYSAKGNGVMTGGTDNLFVLAYATGEKDTEVYIDEIIYEKQILLVDFEDETLEVDLNKEFLLEEYLTLKDRDGISYQATAEVYDAENNLMETPSNVFIPYIQGEYTVEITVELPGGITKTRTLTLYADNNLETYASTADNIRSAGEFNENKGEAGVFVESYTDKNGVTEKGVGKATMKSGESAGRLAVRFNKTEEELIQILNDPNFEAITFRILITYANYTDADVRTLKFFNTVDKQMSVNEWTNITLTKAEIFNATLLNYFGSQEAMISSSGSGTYGFANAFAKTGVGYMQKAWGSAYRMIHCAQYVNPTDVYIDDIKFVTKKGLLDFADIEVDVNFNEEISLDGYLTVKDNRGGVYTGEVEVYNSANQKITLTENKFRAEESKYTIKISVVMDGTTVTRTITVNVGNYLESFNTHANNIKSESANFNANNGLAGTWYESITDGAGVKEYGVGMGTLGASNTGCVPVRFSKTEAELKTIIEDEDFESITFRVLIKDGVTSEGSAVSIKFFNLIEKTVIINRWSDVTLTKAEILQNATLLEEFGSEQALIDAIAAGFNEDGLGFIKQGNYPTHRLIHMERVLGSTRELYVDNVSYTLANVD